MTLKLKTSTIENVEWIVILIILFWQFLFSNYSIVSNIFLLHIYVMQLIKQKGAFQKYNIALILVMIVLFTYSLLLGNRVTFAIRFAIIILFVLSAYSWKSNFKFFLKTLFVVSLIQVVGLILLEIYLFSASEVEYAYIRNEIVQANNMGDVFNYNDIYYKLELRGTSLVAFIYMLSYAVDIFPIRYKKTYRFLYLVGMVLAGNFAYQLTVIIFHFVWYLFSKKSDAPQLTQKSVKIVLLLFLFGSVLWSFVSDTVQAKESSGSLPTRYDQASVLYRDATRSELIFLFGSGLGHTMTEKTSIRDYNDNIYFEVQTLYIANQLGLIGFTFLIVVNVIMAFRVMKQRRLLIVYACYVMYAFTNPYIWDTTHIVVIVSLLCGKYYIKNEKQKDIMCVSPI